MKGMYVYTVMDKIWSGKKTPAEVLPPAVKEINKRMFNK